MKYHHECHVIETSGWISKGKIDPLSVSEEIATYGRDGYRLVAAIPISDGSVGTKRIALFFEKEIRE